jgi:hypothetical protein
MGDAEVVRNHPMDKNFQVHLFWDTMSIQKLIWSICLGIVVAKC